MKRLSATFCTLLAIVLSHPAPAASGNIPGNHDNLELEKVIIFSRHGLRAPEEEEQASALKKYTPYKLEQPKIEEGLLTSKGQRLETYFGQYIGQWLNQHNIPSTQDCRSGQNILVYANSLQRTLATGQALIDGAFPNCKVKLTHQKKTGSMDPLFKGEVRTGSETFQKQVEADINLTKINQNLSPNYRLLADLIDYPHSDECLINKDCTFYEHSGNIRIEKDKRPSIKSSDMRTAKNIVSALMLQYYEGQPLNKIAGGNIDTAQEWRDINQIKNQYLSTVRGNPLVASHIAQPLIQFIEKDLAGNNKVTILVGHDSNIVALLSALGVRDYSLPGQYETTPIGGKVFINVWKDKKTQARKVGLEYVYQSHQQIRRGDKLSLANPPQRTALKLKNCKADKQGLCNYRDFTDILAQNSRLPYNQNP